MRLEVVVLALALEAVSACNSQAMPASIGVVARREPESGRVVVSEVPDGSAAAEAGLEPGDEIVAVDGVRVASMTPSDFHHAVRGEAGTKVQLEVRRDGVLRRFEVVRKTMKPAR